jgi:aminopeptidase N
MLKEWKNDILTNRKFLLGSGQESGPISLGIRTESASTEGDYSLIIYKKGAWVLHMLRNMFIDQKTMNEDLFRGIMHDFYTTYRDSSASTLDFKTVCERHSNMDLGWFFKEWIEGTHIPKYKFAYKINESPEHKFIVTCRVEDADAPDDFKMVVPLYIDFGGDRFVRLRAMVSGKHSEFDLPVLPLTPEKIRFNDLESVLCEVDEVGWK